MTSRELVRRTLEFDGPARIPRNIWVSSWAEWNHTEAAAKLVHDFPQDTSGVLMPYPLVSPVVAGAYRPRGAAYQIGDFTDEWNCTFSVLENGTWGEVKKPLLESWGDLEKVRFPREYLQLDRERVRAACKASDKFMIAPSMLAEQTRPFERIQFLRGTQNVLMDLMEQPPEFLKLLHDIHQFNLDLLSMWAATEVDAVMFADDWGSQNALLVDPTIWRDLFKPLYKEYVDIAHQHGKFILMHSDGYIADILPDLIEIGLDAVNSQIFCMGVEELGRRFRGQITFWGEIDRQHTLSHGSLHDVEKAVECAYDNLYDNGGIIAQCEFGVGARPENVRHVFATWERISSGLNKRQTARLSV